MSSNNTNHADYSQAKVLVPLKIYEEATSESIMNSILKLKDDLNLLIISNELRQNPDDFDQIEMFLNKTWRYINLAIDNENSKSHFASYKLLNSAAKCLENFLIDVEQSSSPPILNLKIRNTLRQFIQSLNSNAEKISRLNNLEIDEETNVESVTPQVNPKEQGSLNKLVESNLLNDWILSDLNLNSEDLNSGLLFISGNLFDLNFSYKFLRVVNKNCFLMKQRKDSNLEQNDKLETKFILKVILV